MIGQQQRARLGLAQDVGQLVGAVARVQRDDDGTEPRACVLGDEPRRPIRQPDGDGVAGADADGGESAGQRARALAQIGEGQALVGEDDRFAVRRSRGDRVDEAGRGGVLERIEPVHEALT